MIDVDRDADAFAQLVAEIVGVRERVHAGAVGGVHRMQRLDRERHAGLRAHGAAAPRAVAHLLARAGDVAASPSAARPTIEHEALRADGGGFVDGAAVVVERRAPAGVVGGGKHAAAAKAGDGHARARG